MLKRLSYADESNMITKKGQGGKNMGDKAIWREYKETGSLDIREAFILNYAPLVRSIARGIKFKMPPSVEYADLVSYGFLGLMDAIERFDPEREIDFSAYARIRISGAVADGVRAERALPRSAQDKVRRFNRAQDALSSILRRYPNEDEMANYLGIEVRKYRQMLADIGNSYALSLDDLLASSDAGDIDLSLLDLLKDENADDPSDVSEKEELKKMVREAINRLPEREKIIVSLYYYEDLSMKEVGEVLDITESRVSQIHSAAVLRLKSILSNDLVSLPV
jgi:RNA polymerase sigma factor for flagellar operon FliA